MYIDRIAIKRYRSIDPVGVEIDCNKGLNIIIGENNSGKTVHRLRQVFFEEFSKSNNYRMIFTYVWALDHQGDWDYIKYVSDLFKEQGADVYYVELVATQEIRLERNSTENRLNNKPSKRNLDFARKDLLDTDEKYRTESYDGEIPFPNYIKIDNSSLAPNVVAEMIKDRFNL